MEEQSLDKTECDVNATVEVTEDDVADSAELVKPDGESCAVEVKVEAEEKEESVDIEEKEEAQVTSQATNEEDKVNIQCASEQSEEELEVSVVDELPVSDVFEEDDASKEEIFTNENEALEWQVKEDDSESTADSQSAINIQQELLQELQTEHETLSHLNCQLQIKLSKYFWLISGGDLQSLKEILPSQDFCQKYPDVVKDIEKKTQEKKQTQLQCHLVDELQCQYNEKLKQIKHESIIQASDIRKVVIRDLEKAMRKMDAHAEAESLLTALQKCEEEFVSVRQEHFKLNLKMSNLDAGIRVREDDINGETQRVDFEQLKLENKIYNERTQENIKQLLELKKTFPQTGQIMMHLKEKLRFVEAENLEKQEHCYKLDALILNERKALLQTMQARDILRSDNLRMQKDSGLLDKPDLLRDFEDTEDKREILESRLVMLKES